MTEEEVNPAGLEKSEEVASDREAGKIESKKYVYSFKEGKKEMKQLLGGKGANLAEMTSLGLPIPPGFTISTEACQKYYDNDEALPKNIQEEVENKLKELEEDTGKKLGDNENPLLVSVRSGAAKSMPGMMDTVLNLGLNDESVEGLAKQTGNDRFAWDSYRRFIQMFGDVVIGINNEHFEKVLDNIKEEKGVEQDTELETEDLKKIVERYKDLFKKETEELFPNDPKEQLSMSIDAVFGSWNNSRAIKYRNLNSIKGLIGTAVNVQMMVFGNMGKDSGTGVAFTRNPSTGEKKMYGEFLIDAQGEDVVAGIRTPEKIDDLKEKMPEIHSQLSDIKENLEKNYKDMQDLEFTIEKGKLYILQTRDGKRTANAAVKIAADMVEEGLVKKKEALLRVDPNSLNQLLHKQLSQEEKETRDSIAKGLPASPGAAKGKVVFDSDEAADRAHEGEDVILVRKETSPEDIEGMHAAKGILTSRGGMTSHAAVVARGMGKCCIAGCSDLNISENEKVVEVNGKVINKGDILTLDGGTGEVYEGEIEMVEPDLRGNFAKIMEWSDEFRDLGIMTNADTPEDAKKAINFGAEGIGLCRTEHMFFEESRIKAVREMILSETKDARKKALDKILPMQKEDFAGIFRAMYEKPITIRLLDPPLHEFLPKEDEDIQNLAKELGVEPQDIKKKISDLYEFNPMLGHRGCRLAISYPEITEMQSKAIFEAAADIKSEGGNVKPEVMVPLVGNVKEFENQKKIIDDVAKTVQNEKGIEINYKIGTMIEVPRGALTADKIAKKAEFFSFGTNDLTQMTLGISRDDAGFLQNYDELGIYDKPFQSLDQEGVGELMKIAIRKGKEENKNLKVGICGEHGGDPSTIEFCYNEGLNYVSCSPFRVPVARLAAAQANVKKENNGL